MTIKEKQRAAAAAAFAERWLNKEGYESGEKQIFWIELLQEVFGVERPGDIIIYEERVKDDTTKRIDVRIPSTKVLIEHKSRGENIKKKEAIVENGKTKMLSPYGQALRYIGPLPKSQHPDYVVICNFDEFNIYDMEHPKDEPEVVMLADLGHEYYRLQFLIDNKSSVISREEHVSKKAGEIVGIIYDQLRKQYINPNSTDTLRSLNILCVRLVFCLYAEDAGLFERNAFHNYLFQYPAKDLRRALKDLFDTLNTPYNDRDNYLNDDLKEFPYVNGGLFSKKDIEIPQLTEEIKTLLLKDASSDFDWSEISPTIFGAIFESTLDWTSDRRSGGMHYTSVENIHKVIDPLFLNRLTDQLERILAKKDPIERRRDLVKYQQGLANLTFLDPACGSGNFLTETYISLRRLENRAIQARYIHGRANTDINLSEFDLIKVGIHQLHGIEINDFAVSVATTALWIAESQMLAETERIIHQEMEYLPLKANTNIVEGNALELDWTPTDYIIGNPPFIGARLMSKSQKKDLVDTFGADWRGVGNMDYVCGWYKRAVGQMQQHPQTRTALVSTNSITQGEQVANLWRPLVEQQAVQIDFAHRTFVWDNEAHVHCVIIGFSIGRLKKTKVIYDGVSAADAKHINAYLLDDKDVWLESRTRPICNVPEMVFGNMPNDNHGQLLLNQEAYDVFLASWPHAKKYIRRVIGAKEFIQNIDRYCLWLKDSTPSERRQSHEVMRRLDAIREARAKSSRLETQNMADTPYLFGEDRQPDTPYILVPRHSSEERRYIPIGFMSADIICGDSNMMIPNATLYHFGVLTSSLHMAWVRTVCGRLEMRIRYSKDIVYNNFPWPSPTKIQREKIEETAQAILDARALYPNDSLAALYNSNNMPSNLLKAHQANDRAVMEAYGLDLKSTESQCLAKLFKLYQKIITL